MGVFARPSVFVSPVLPSIWFYLVEVKNNGCGQVPSDVLLCTIQDLI